MDRTKLNINLPYGVRTTATVDSILYEYFATSIDLNPDEPGSRRAAEKWLEDRLGNMTLHSLSAHVRHLMIAEIAKPDLEDKLQRARMSVS